MAKKVFISYRRVDSEAIAGRPRDRLLTRLPDNHVFFDSGSIQGGDLFRDRILRAASTFDTMIVIIGQKWLGPMEGGPSRIFDSDDYVRLEVRTALSRGDMAILPVLVDGAKVPDRRDVPEDVGDLLRHNVMQLGNASFDRDFEALFARVQGKTLAAGTIGPTRLALSVVWGAVLGCVAALATGVFHWMIFKQSLAASLGGDVAVEFAVFAIIVAGALAGARQAGRRRRG